MVGTGPRWAIVFEKDPKIRKIKNRKRESCRRPKGDHLGEPSKWSRSSKSNQRSARARPTRHRVQRRPKEENVSGYSTTIVAEIIS